MSFAKQIGKAIEYMQSIGIDDFILRPRYIYILKHDEVKIMLKRTRNSTTVNKDDWRYDPPEIITKGSVRGREGRSGRANLLVNKARKC